MANLSLTWCAPSRGPLATPATILASPTGWDAPNYLRGESWRDDSTAPVLICPCGEDGCSPVYAHITIADDVVIWSDFAQPNRDADFSKLGPFVFARDQYERELARLPRLH